MYSETAKSIKNWINRCLLEVPSLQYKGVIALRLRSIYCITIHMPVLEYIFIVDGFSRVQTIKSFSVLNKALLFVIKIESCYA